MKFDITRDQARILALNSDTFLDQLLDLAFKLDGLTEEEKTAMEACQTSGNNKILAIRTLREKHRHLGLADAKDLVFKFWDKR